MILASVQTSADTAPFVGYAEGAGKFLAIVAAFIGACWLIDRYIITPRMRPHIDAVLRNGDDREVREFAAQVEAWDAYQTALARRTR